MTRPHSTPTDRFTGTIALTGLHNVHVRRLFEGYAWVPAQQLVLINCSINAGGGGRSECHVTDRPADLVLDSCNLSGDAARLLACWPTRTLRLLRSESKTVSVMLRHLAPTLIELDFGSSKIDMTDFVEATVPSVETLILHQSRVVGQLDILVEVMPKLQVLNISSTQCRFSRWDMLLQFKKLQRIVTAGNPCFTSEEARTLLSSGAAFELEG